MIWHFSVTDIWDFFCNFAFVTISDYSNITFADENGDGLVGKNEVAQIYFDLINTGDEPLFGITPVIMADKTKHLLISDPAPIDTLDAKSTLRYVVEIAGDQKGNAGKVHLLLRINYGKQQYADIQEIRLGSLRRKD